MNIAPRKKVWLIVSLSKVSGREMMSGILEYLSDRHDWNLEIDTHPERITPARFKVLLTAGLNGIILTLPCPPPVQQLLSKSKLPIVCVNVVDDLLALRKAPTRFVWMDNAAIGRAAADHLVSCGTFASYLFVGESDLDWSEARGRGFRAALQRHKLDGKLVHTTLPSIPPSKSETLSFRRLLKNLPRPTAVFAAYDEIAHGVIRSANVLGLKIPEQLIVVGADNAKHVVEPDALSSVRLDHRESGFKAAASLHRLMRGSAAAPEPITIAPMDVVSRKSTRYQTSIHMLIRDIDSYLKHHAAERTCNAETVARHFSFSRSSIEHRYRASTGKSLYQAILDVRLATAVSRMKRHPDEPLADIAQRCGFSSASHLSHRLKADLNTTSRSLRGASLDFNL